MKKLYNSTNERVTAYYKKRKGQNLCYTCWKNPPSLEINKFGKPGGQCNDCRTKRATKYKEVGKPLNQDRKIKAFLRYGGLYCACCGISQIEFLSLDHIDNDGAKQRKLIGKRAANFYTWLEQNNYPAGLQVLCMNCNLGKQLNNGVCPHVTERQASV